jgi:hypothetical protein
MRCWADADRGHTPVLALPLDGRLVKSWLPGRILTLSADLAFSIRGNVGHLLIRLWALEPLITARNPFDNA